MFPLLRTFFNVIIDFSDYFALSVWPGLNIYIYHIFIAGVESKSISVWNLKFIYIEAGFINSKC